MDEKKKNIIIAQLRRCAKMAKTASNMEKATKRLYKKMNKIIDEIYAMLAEEDETLMPEEEKERDTSNYVS